jgi:hypothetical protein
VEEGIVKQGAERLLFPWTRVQHVSLSQRTKVLSATLCSLRGFEDRSGILTRTSMLG